jgi:hypothetical protein
VVLILKEAFSEIMMNKSLSSKYRTEICGLPPKLAFSPSSTTSSSNDERYQHQQEQMLSWKKQLREEELWTTAVSNTKCLLNDVISFWEEQLQQRQEGKEQKKDVSRLLSDDLTQLFGRRIIIVPKHADIINRLDTWLTVYDLEKIAKLFQDHLSFDGSNDYGTRLFAQGHLPEKKTGPNSCWYEIIIMPYNNAANQILKIYEKNKTSSPSQQQLITQQYLKYRAIRTMEEVKYFKIPFYKRQLSQMKQYHHNEQQRLQNELEQRYNDAFEKLDDYCINVLGVESDNLPLFPEQQLQEEKFGEITVHSHQVIDQVIDEYSFLLGKHVRKIMFNELEQLSRNFLTSFEGNRMVISNAIAYYEQFIGFVSSKRWQRDSHLHESANTKSDEILSTLAEFATSSSVLLTSQFMHSSSTRVTLVSDLQQLDAFLASRRQELSSRVGGGRDVAEAIDLAWSRYCISTSTARAATSGCNFRDITFDEISQYASVTQSILAQIIGDRLQAKRLRLLADALGCPPEQEAFRFNILCRRGAELAYKMSLYQRQLEASTRTMECCHLDIELRDEELRLQISRLDYLIATLRCEI